MLVTLRDMVGLAELGEMRLVAGSAGLDRVLNWAHVVDLPDVTEWVKGGELLFTTGIGIKSDLGQLAQIVRECHKMAVAGLVINVGPYIEQTPQEVIAVADELGFPVFELPWKVKIVEITRIIYNFIALKSIEEKSIKDILENILYGSPDSHEDILARAASYDYDLDDCYQIMVVKFDNLAAYLRETRVLTEHQILVFKSQLQSKIEGILGRHGKRALTFIRLDTAIVMLPTRMNPKEQQTTREIASDIKAEFEIRFAGLKLHIGWGNPYSQVGEAKKGLSQAEQALRVARSGGGTPNTMSFNELGFYKVLFNVKDRQELEGFRCEILRPLLDYDRDHQSELVDTLSIFLEENENYARVSSRLYIHRNTLKYRLQKIVELSGRDLNDSNDRMLLYFATIVHKFLSF
ncbi:MAG: PucR family transcriptional regulator ligand-binding domain-containing protein [Negativicutes bacterium]|nr:PucR family transcriptional regulator ligand-binding domain-containing protein [Negativicutes bacterium]